MVIHTYNVAYIYHKSYKVIAISLLK